MPWRIRESEEVRLSNNRYKLLMVDIDGTLIGKDRTISAKDKNALARARDSGILVSLSTGRAVEACRAIIDQLSLDGYHIFFDGALVSNPDSGEVVYIEPIGEECVRQMAEFAHLNEVNLDLQSATHYFIERETWVTDIRRHFFGVEPAIVDFSEVWQKEKIIKATLTSSSAEEKAKADSFCRKFKDSLGFTLAKTPVYPEVDFINVVAPNVSKGKALDRLAPFLGMPLTEVMAIGDGDNDISLLSSAGLAVAMDNALDAVKAVADFVTLDVDHNGVAAAIEKFLL